MGNGYCYVKKWLSGGPKCEPIKICYINSLYKYSRKVCVCSITIKIIKDIVKGAKCNFIEQIC